MEIKVNRIFKMEGFAALKAFADVCVNDTIVIKGFKVLEGRNGLFVTWPQTKAKDNKWYESVQCLDKEMKTRISSEVLIAYDSYNGNLVA